MLKAKGTTNKKDTGLYGPFEADDFYGLVRPDMLYAARADYEKSLTTHLYKACGPNGFGAAAYEYFTYGHINVRNMNMSIISGTTCTSGMAGHIRPGTRHFYTGKESPVLYQPDPGQ